MTTRILLVEDNRGDARLLSEALDEVGVHAEIDHWLDAVGAWRSLVRASEADARLPDLVVTNLNLPIMHGDRLIALIRDRLDLAHLPILVLTTSDDPADRQRCRQADAYLVKGAGWDDAVAVADQIAQLLEAARARRDLR